jgi:hypothetical protein
MGEIKWLKIAWHYRSVRVSKKITRWKENRPDKALRISYLTCEDKTNET